MDKIKELMEKMGFSSELSAGLMEAISSHIEAEKKALQEELSDKLKKAKEVCIEAVKEEKARLAKGVGVYLESKSGQIDRARAQQLALEESKSIDLNKKVKALLEGVDLSKVDDKNGQLQAASRKISLLEQQSKRLMNENKDLQSKLQNSNAIATKAVRKAMMLEESIKKPAGEKSATPTGNGKTIAEDKAKAEERLKSLNEAKKTNAPVPHVKRTEAYSPDNIADMI